jgi:hypothetical protein
MSGNIEILPERYNIGIHFTCITIVKFIESDSTFGQNRVSLVTFDGYVIQCLICDVTDEASEDLNSQVNERRENHKQLLEDLNSILDQVSLIWQRIGKKCTNF